MAKSGIIPILGKGELELSIIHVDDVINGIIRAGFTEVSNGEIFYLSDGRVHTLAEVANILSTITGMLGDCISRFSGKPQITNSQKVKEVLQKGWVCDTDKIREQLGFHPNIELGTGFELTYHWYRNAGWL
jgi:nucleoside-diphosphate-sugar epimerase